MHHIAMKRETEFEIYEIASHLSQSSISKKLLLNELGVIFLDPATTKRKRLFAERLLVDGLQSNNMDVKFISYCQLRRANGTASTHTHEAVYQFRLDDTHHQMIEIAKETLWL